MEPRKYQFNNSTITIIFGNLLESKADVIVSSDDSEISMGGGVSGAIRKAGGEIIRIDAQKKAPITLGDVVVSSSGALVNQKFVFHCVTLAYEDRADLQKKLSQREDLQVFIIQHSVNKCFSLLHALELSSIAFPCIGAGAAHFPIAKVAEVMADAISANLMKTQKQLNVELYLFDRFNQKTDMDYIDMFEHFAVKSAIAKQVLDEEANMARSHKEDLPNVNGEVVIPKREDMTHKVFISYSSNDKEYANSITKLLKKQNIPYWIDETGIFSGENFKEVIVDAIDCSEVVIFMSSANSNDSYYVRREISYAVWKRKVVIPIMLDDAPYAKSIRLDIADISQIQFNSPDFESKLINSLALHLC